MTAVAEPTDHAATLDALTLAEKAALCSGQGFWNTRAVERLGIESIKMSDGPHGLRVQIEGGDHLGIDSSEPATCFPPAVTLGCTWDPDLARQVGAAIGAEARAAGLALVLGPGVNIKRSPLCGRNFEYFSEDPLVASTMATEWVRGLQSRGVGASLKHFAANNQETDRLRVSAEIDERTLREIYLAAFEPVVRDASPWTVMCAYNRLNGTYAAEHHWLLTEVLRDEWGFDGLVVSDWGAVDDPAASVRAGLDLEMPSTGGMSVRQLVAAVDTGGLRVSDLDRAVGRLLSLLERAKKGASVPAMPVDAEAHHELARRVAAQGAVLLRNEGGRLPIRPEAGQRISVIGELARDPRYQGAGSSQVNPTRVDTALDALREGVGDGVTVDFSAGYSLVAGETKRGLIDEAVATADGADHVIVFVGLPPSAESEGFDRTTLDLPVEQLELVEALAHARHDIIVVLANGGVVTLGAFDTVVDAILECFLGGQASGGAVADVLLGAVNPSGKLTETIPRDLASTTAGPQFPGSERVVHYGEGLFVGYRGYDTAGTAVAYPFGFGLSYTTFDYADLTIEIVDDGTDGDLASAALQVTATITNTGDVVGAEVIQLYVGQPDSPVARPVHELRGFTKVTLEPGEVRQVSFVVTRRDLARWSIRTHDWMFDPGTYEVAVAASSRDLRLVETVEIPGVAPVVPLDTDSTLAEWLDHPRGRDVFLDTLRTSPLGDLSGLVDDVAQLRMIGPFPLKRLLAMLGGVYTLDDLARFIDEANRPRPSGPCRPMPPLG